MYDLIVNLPFNVARQVYSFFEGLWNDWIIPIYEEVAGIVDGIVSGITDFLRDLFVPDEEYFSSKFDLLNDEFAFMGDIIEIGEVFTGIFSRSTMSDPEPPVLYVDLGAAENGVNYGGKVKVLDLSWYAPYKADVDLLVSSILWCFFGWRLFVYAPNFFSGVSVGVGSFSKISRDFGSKGRKSGD